MSLRLFLLCGPAAAATAQLARKRQHKAKLIVLLSVLVLATGRRAGADPVTEADVIRLSQSLDADMLAARAAALVAEAEQVRAGLYPNPSLGWERESSPGRVAGREIEDAFFLTLPIELSGRRAAQSALARSSAANARARAARTRSGAVATALEVFYGALAADRDADILAQAVTRLEEAARVVRRRHEEGTTSGYEFTRIQLESELARSRLSDARTRASAARATFAALLGFGADAIELRGDLAIAPKRDSAPTASQRPSLALLYASAAEARKARSAARWAWIPALSLSGGVRISEATESRYGYVAGASLSLPLFSRGQDLLAESSARQGLAVAETRAAERVIRVEEARAREQLLATQAELERFTQATADRVELLVRAAESGYREGDRSVVELLDAQRARTDVERRRLELELMAVRADIQRRAATGEFE